LLYMTIQKCPLSSGLQPSPLLPPLSIPFGRIPLLRSFPSLVVESSPL
jgi:hypothetical protein